MPQNCLRSSESFVLQHRRFNELHQRIAEQVRVMAIVEPERHFVQVGRKMLCRDLMPRSDNAALEQRESGFNAVRRNVSLNVDALTMVDGLVRHPKIPASMMAFG